MIRERPVQPKPEFCAHADCFYPMVHWNEKSFKRRGQCPLHASIGRSLIPATCVETDSEDVPDGFPSYAAVLTNEPDGSGLIVKPAAHPTFVHETCLNARDLSTHFARIKNRAPEECARCFQSRYIIKIG